MKAHYSLAVNKKKNPRTKQLPAIRVTSDELDRIKGHARRARKSLSDWMRWILLRGNVRVVSDKPKKRRPERNLGEREDPPSSDAGDGVNTLAPSHRTEEPTTHDDVTHGDGDTYAETYGDEDEDALKQRQEQQQENLKQYEKYMK